MLALLRFSRNVRVSNTGQAHRLPMHCSYRFTMARIQRRSNSCRMLLLLAGLSALCASAQAVKVVVPPGHTECIAETIGDEHFEVYGARLDGRVLVKGNNQYYVPFVTIKVTGPNGDGLWQQAHVYAEAHFNVQARGSGTYQVCFTNPWESRTDAAVDLVYFTLAHLRNAGQVRIPKGTSDHRNTEVAHQDHLDQVRRTILQMSEFMQVISGSQRYLQRKLDRHKMTMESNKSRTLWYSLLEALAIVAVSGVQIFTITRFFQTGRLKLSV